MKQLGIPFRETDFDSVPDLENALKGTDTLIHALGLINGEEAMLQKVNITYTENLTRAAKKCGVRKVIFISSVAALMRHGPYGKSKFEAEEIVRKSGVPFTIFRPAFIYGDRDENNLAMMTRTLRNFPLVPLLGGGTFRLQPVFVGDVVSLIHQAVERAPTNAEHSVAGPEQISLKQMLVTLAGRMRVKRGFIPIPLRPVQAVMRVYLRLVPRTRLPAKQILELDKHEAFDISATRRDFQFDPVAFAEGSKRLSL